MNTRSSEEPAVHYGAVVELLLGDACVPFTRVRRN